MKNPPMVRLTAMFVAVGVLAVAVFAAFYILGAIAAVIVCIALGVGLVALAGVASTKIAAHKARRIEDQSLAASPSPAPENRA